MATSNRSRQEKETDAIIHPSKPSACVKPFIQVTIVGNSKTQAKRPSVTGATNNKNQSQVVGGALPKRRTSQIQTRGSLRTSNGIQWMCSTQRASASAPEMATQKENEKEKPGNCPTKTKSGATRGANATRPDHQKLPPTKPKPTRAQQPKTTVQPKTTRMQTRSMAVKAKSPLPPSNLTQTTRLLADKKTGAGKIPRKQTAKVPTRPSATVAPTSTQSGEPNGKLLEPRSKPLEPRTTLLPGEQSGTTAGQLLTVTGPRGTAVSTESLSLPSALLDLVPRHAIDMMEGPEFCKDYSAEIYVYYRQLEEETHYLISATFLKHQMYITSKQRRILVDWLAQVHMRYRLMQETMTLTIDILDRYLQVALVTKSKLQLVGLASLFISAKYEEIYSVRVQDLANISANTYTKSDILLMERTILRKLDYRFLKPYPIHFLRRYSRLAHTDVNVHHLAKYLIDLCLLETEGSALLPSRKAAAAFLLANIILYKSQLEQVWSKEMKDYTGYSLSHLSDAIKVLLSIVKDNYTTDKAAAITEKYSKSSPTPELAEKLENKDLGLDNVKISGLCIY